MNYGQRFATLPKRQESRPSPKKEMPKIKMGVCGGFANSCEKKTSKKAMEKR